MSDQANKAHEAVAMKGVSYTAQSLSDALKLSIKALAVVKDACDKEKSHEEIAGIVDQALDEIDDAVDNIRKESEAVARLAVLTTDEDADVTHVN